MIVSSAPRFACPHCGPRPAAEFVVVGNRDGGQGGASSAATPETSVQMLHRGGCRRLAAVPVPATRTTVPVLAAPPEIPAPPSEVERSVAPAQDAPVPDAPAPEQRSLVFSFNHLSPNEGEARSEPEPSRQLVDTLRRISAAPVLVDLRERRARRAGDHSDAQLGGPR